LALAASNDNAALAGSDDSECNKELTAEVATEVHMLKGTYQWQKSLKQSSGSDGCHGHQATSRGKLSVEA